MSDSPKNEPEHSSGLLLIVALLHVVGTMINYHYQSIRSWLDKLWLMQQPTSAHHPFKRMAWIYQDRPLWAWAPLLWYILWIILRGGVPPMDDLIRHIGAYRHHFDYNNYYLYSQPLNALHMDPWIGFEWLAGHLHAAIWKMLGILYHPWRDLNRNVWALALTQHIIVATAFVLFGMIFVPIFRNAFRYHPMRHTMTGFALVGLLIIKMFWRLQLARPEVFMMLAMFSVWRLPPRIWVSLMMLIQPLYWLAWTYSLGVLLISRWTPIQKMIAACLIIGAYTLFWQWYCGLEAIAHFFSMTFHAMENRSLPVEENNSPLQYLFKFSGFSLVILLLLTQIIRHWGEGTLNKSERNSILVLMSIYILTNQIRYFYYCAPCLMYLWAWQPHHLNNHDQNHPAPPSIQRYLPILLTLTAAISGYILSIHDGFKSQLVYFETLPANARVLTFFNQSTFMLPTLYPSVKVAPSMELGFSDKPLQNFLVQRFFVRNTSIDCKTFKDTLGSFTYIVDRMGENIPINPPSHCLELQEVYGFWVLWHVVQ